MMKTFMLVCIASLVATSAVACPWGKETDTVSEIWREMHYYVILESQYSCGHRYLIRREVPYETYLSLGEGMGFDLIEGVEIITTGRETATYRVLSKFADAKWYYQRSVRGTSQTVETYPACATQIMSAARRRDRRVTSRDDGQKRIIDIGG